MKWKKSKQIVEGKHVTGYQIRYSLKSNMKNSKMVTVKGFAKTSKKINIQKKKTKKTKTKKKTKTTKKKKKKTSYRGNLQPLQSKKINKKKKTYYVQVRTIYVDDRGAKHYSSWSKKKSK